MKNSHIMFDYADDRITKLFWSRVKKTDECWKWTGFRDKDGYGHYTLRVKPLVSYTYKAHRLCWFIHYGDPGDKCVCHRCDNPWCVNPHHLFLGTRKENSQDMIIKGRHTNGKELLTKPDAARIREQFLVSQKLDQGITQRYLAKLYDIHFNSIHKVIKGITYRN